MGEEAEKEKLVEMLYSLIKKEKNEKSIQLIDKTEDQSKNADLETTNEEKDILPLSGKTKEIFELLSESDSEEEKPAKKNTKEPKAEVEEKTRKKSQSEERKSIENKNTPKKEVTDSDVSDSDMKENT